MSNDDEYLDNDSESEFEQRRTSIDVCDAAATGPMSTNDDFKKYTS